MKHLACLFHVLGLLLLFPNVKAIQNGVVMVMNMVTVGLHATNKVVQCMQYMYSVPTLMCNMKMQTTHCQNVTPHPCVVVAKFRPCLILGPLPGRPRMLKFCILTTSVNEYFFFALSLSHGGCIMRLCL